MMSPDEFFEDVLKEHAPCFEYACKLELSRAELSEALQAAQVKIRELEEAVRSWQNEAAYAREDLAKATGTRLA